MRHNQASIIPLGVEPFIEKNVIQDPKDALGTPDIKELLREENAFKLVYLAAFVR